MIKLHDKNGKLVGVKLTREEQSDLVRRNIEYIRSATKVDLSKFRKKRRKK